MVNIKNNKLMIPLGPTWSGFEFITVQRYKRKTGYKISFVCKYWSGKFRTLKTAQAETVEEIIQKIRETLYFRLSDEVVGVIRQFCGGV